MIKFVCQEIDPEHVWINISKGKTVRAAVLTACGNICRGVYKLEDEMLSTVKEMVRCAEEGENIRFYIIEEVKEDNNDVTR
ncbi:MAG: hypothetical protein IJ880_01850 [Bacilli bacterium]|nr:hypothetical protein [Bacilli bacterium]